MSQVFIKLSSGVAAEDVEEWPDPATGNLTFTIFKSCTFEPGAEGLALGYLASVVGFGGEISLKCEFDLPKTAIDFYSTILSSIFGYTLIRMCRAAYFAKSGENNRNELRAFSGRTYDDQQGIVGLGNEVRLIAFDPKRPIPKALLSSSEALDSLGLPLPSAFHKDIVRILGGMGLPEIASPSTLPTIISFIHELFINTCQHGKPSQELVALQSTRGIALSKIAYSTQQLSSRRVSVALREFLERVAEIQKRQTNLLVVCLSVMDMGDGIQNTLPPMEGETEIDRLFRAFQLGQSRKNTGGIERGAGLHRVVEAAHRLGARLQVSSAGRRIVKDFSLGEDKLPDMSGAIETSLPKHFCGGTSIELFIPQFVTNIDQRELII